MNWLLKKKINIVYLIASFSIVALAYGININFRETLPRKLSESIFWLTVPVFIFSFLTLMVRESTFRSWLKMTNYFFSLSLLILLLTPTYTHGLDFFPVVKETVSIALAIFYSAISLILIIYKSFKKDIGLVE